MAERAGLETLFDPRSVAIVGASDDPVKWGHWIALRAQRGAHRRAVHFVNRRGGTVLGQPAHRALAELPEAIDLAVLSVPAAALEQGVRDAVAAGARAIVAISGSERDGDAGGALDAALAATARAGGARLLGPNCLGVFDAGAELELVSEDLPRGAIGFISQSGNLALEIGAKAARVGLGFSRFISLGNQADIEAAELVGALAGHPETRAIAVYAEDFRDGRAFAAAAEHAAAAGKPMLLLAIEHTEATARAVRSHTGALATDGATIDAACRAAGIERVRSPQELVDVAAALLDAPRPRGRRVAVVADGGGHGGVAAALAHGAGLDVPALSDALAARVRAMLPPSAAVTNPIDLAGGGEQDVSCFGRIVDALLESAEVDAVLLTGYFGGYAAYASDLAEQESAAARAMAAAVAASERPLIVHSMHETGTALTALGASGVPVYGAIERAVDVLGRLAGTRDRPATGVPPLPPPAPPATDTGYAAVRSLLAAGGVPFVAAETATTTADAVAAATRLSYPVVLKALGALHKSDAGGVVLGIADEAQLRTAVEVVERRLAPAAMSVERMAPLHEGIELIAGCRWDARFGPVVMVGIGGVHTETLADVGLALAPIDEAAAERLLRALRGAPLLLGARGRVPLDVRAAAGAVAALSRVAAEHPELAEIEVNPLLVTAAGALGLDARAISFAASGSL